MSTITPRQKHRRAAGPMDAALELAVRRLERELRRADTLGSRDPIVLAAKDAVLLLRALRRGSAVQADQREGRKSLCD